LNEVFRETVLFLLHFAETTARDRPCLLLIYIFSFKTKPSQKLSRCLNISKNIWQKSW